MGNIGGHTDIQGVRDIKPGEESTSAGCLHVFGILAKNRLLARAAQNDVSMFASLCGAATESERSFRDVFPGIV